MEAGGRLLVQPAVHPETGERKRIFEDHEYAQAGAEPREDLSEARIIFGLKEVEISSLLPDRTYAFFSHTHKGQKKNRALLRAMTASGTTFIDYELIADSSGRRLLTAFGDFAGYAGIVDTLWTFGRRLAAEGIRNPFEDVPQAIRRPDLSSVREILRTVGRRIAREGERIHRVLARDVDRRPGLHVRSRDSKAPHGPGRKRPGGNGRNDFRSRSRSRSRSRDGC